jgi:hypothetical protein
LVRPPIKNLPILNLNHGWYVYFVSLVACGFLGVTLVHLPSLIVELKNKIKKSKSKNDNSTSKNNTDTIAE